MAIGTNRTSTTSVLNGGTGFGGLMPAYWSTVLGTNLYPSLYLYQFGEVRKIPKNFGQVIKIPRSLKRSTAFGEVVATSEGAATITSRMSVQLVSGTMRQFAFAYRHSDIVLMTSLSDIVDLSVKEIARQAALTVDTVIRNTISATGGFIGGSGVTLSESVKTTSILKSSDLLKAAVKLDAQNNPRPVDGHYPFVTHPLALYDLQSTLSANAWVEVNKYNPEGLAKLYRGEMGRIFGTKIVTSTNTKRLVSGLSVASSSGYRSFMFAPEPFMVTSLEGAPACEVIIKPRGSAGAADPTNKFGSVGANIYFAVIPATWTTAESRVQRVIHGSNVT
jgi:N4-gp56 family major capsid protein